MSNTLYWLTDDLRTQDNPALNIALDSERLLCAYIHDPSIDWPIQGAAAWWLHHSLAALAKSYEAMGQLLHTYKGETLSILRSLITAHKIEKLVCARAYTPHERDLQKELNEWCQQAGVRFIRSPSKLLAEPEQVKNKQDSYYRVFTPFSKYYFQNHVRTPISLQPETTAKPIADKNRPTLDSLQLLPKLNWAENFSSLWQPGEEGAWQSLKQAIRLKVEPYDASRDFMAEDGTSKLSPHLRFGEISPAQVWQEVSNTIPQECSFSYLRQLVWREFNHHLLFHRSDLPNACFNPKFAHFPWREDSSTLKLWQNGLTGYPVVDAAMKQLWNTGWMHNRARMIVASFLTKHLLISWQDGARWFWDTLLDADLANNLGGWQWTAGCGADAAPYFRIFNPITQGEKFDPKGSYTREWLPELTGLPDKYLFKPWEAPSLELASENFTLGKNYPAPIVEHADARKRALEAYQSIKSQS